MKQLIWAFLVLVTTSAPVWPQTPLERVRGLLDNAAVDELEREMIRLNDIVLAGGSAADLREIHARLFETTHTDRIAVVEDWLLAYPASPYAVTAKAWISLAATEQWGADSARYSKPELIDRAQLWSRAREQSLGMIGQALELSDSYVPALDAWLRSRETRPVLDDLPTISNALFDVSPTRSSIRKIIKATSMNAPNLRQDVLEICLNYAPRAADYNQDICMIEAEFSHYLGNDIREVAKASLVEIGDKRLDWVRLKIWLRSKPRDPNFAEHALELHTLALTTETDLENYFYATKRIAFASKRPDYAETMTKQVLALADVRLADDPLNRKLLQLRAELLLQAYQRDANADDLAAARSDWENLMAYANANAQTWRLGASLAIADREPWNFYVQRVFLENTNAYSGQNLLHLLENVYALNNAKVAAQSQVAAGVDGLLPDPVQVLEEITCPLLRAAITADAMCRTFSPPLTSLCNPKNPYFEPVPKVLAEGRAGSCKTISQTPLSELRYEAIPIDQLKLPWQKSLD